MELDGRKLKDKARAAMSKLRDNMKETYYSIADIPSSSVQELADFIQEHPDTQEITKHLLGNTYTFFTLDLNEYHFYLETRAGRILQLDGSLHGKTIVSYRSYRDVPDLHSPVKLK
ncbi:hypothetical protein CN378_18260 [Bacillus sp. AFS015802]|uniref:hypothetical protein n=1 Tax=Bacillus sp. AFS015802 TaxID=2033486 RepID=UPI000BF69AA8|nr:hypothetical protein [Bacillus sp. AFS015802]PFA62984.1 hypothetical protein CN378_18260 [Bacillus sp. AFS015802]